MAARRAVIRLYTSALYTRSQQGTNTGWGQLTLTKDELQAGTHGPHHCIATASTITDMIFRYLRARCAAQGGALSFEDLDDACARFLESVPSGFDLFETIHARCMQASGSTAAALFTRKALLTTLLFECVYHSAHVAFAEQTARFGFAWLRHFFHGLACHIREAVCKDADFQLVNVYVRAANKLKGRLSAAELLKEPEVQRLLRKCMMSVITATPAEVQALRDTVNRNIAIAHNNAGPDLGKITHGELQRFIGLMRNELELTLKNAGSVQQMIAMA